MQTIGRRRPGNSPPGDYVTMCDICGTGYYRSELVRKPDGLLYCADDAPGMDRVTIAEELKRASLRRMRPLRFRDGGNFDQSDDPPADGDRPLPFNGPSAGKPGDGIADP